MESCSSAAQRFALVGVVITLPFIALHSNTWSIPLNYASSTAVRPSFSTVSSAMRTPTGPQDTASSSNFLRAQLMGNPQVLGYPQVIPSPVLRACGFVSCVFAGLAFAINKVRSRKGWTDLYRAECSSHHSVSMAAVMGDTAPGSKRHAFALIVNNKGGGHGEIGLHLALALRSRGLEVQLINDTGGKDISSKLPFSEYAQLIAAGVETTFADLSKPGALDSVTCPPGHLCRAYDYIFDNENVCQKDVADLAAQCGAFYVYVSSGGMYIPGDKFPMKESNPSKGADSNEQKKHEEYVMSSQIRSRLRGCAFFRPQYIVGPYTNKRDYLDWFFDRLTRNLPVPLPAPGTQTTTITDVRDVANMLACVVGKEVDVAEAEKACTEVGPVFNCASDRPVTLREITIACGLACGKTQAETEALIRLYDPKLAKEAPSGGKFPFRATNFDVGVDKAKVVLEWEPEYNDFEQVAVGYYEGYRALGLDKNNPKMDTSFDEFILARI